MLYTWEITFGEHETYKTHVAETIEELISKVSPDRRKDITQIIRLQPAVRDPLNTTWYIGDRVEVKHHLDTWMMGDRYGTIDNVKELTVIVKMDRSKRRIVFSKENIIRVE